MINNTWKPFLALLVSAGVLASCKTTQPDRFTVVDVDRSSQLSRDEVSDYLVVTVFESRDANKDGKMTETEWLVQDDKGRTKQFRIRDTNKDGLVTLEEAKAYARSKGLAVEVLKEADINKNGTLSREEVRAYYASKEGPIR